MSPEPLASAYCDDIDRLCGIESQWISHYHDTMPAGGHEDVWTRFGCKLYHHRAEGRHVLKRTKCPTVKFGDEGIKLNSDFEVHYFPGHTPGLCIFRWCCEGKYFLFTTHVVDRSDGEWALDFRPDDAAHVHPQFSLLANLQVDYLLPGYSASGSTSLQCWV